MMNADENTPIAGKNGKAEPPAKKAAKRNRKAPQQGEPKQGAPKQEPVEQPQEPIAAAAIEDPPADIAPVAPAPAEAPDAPAPAAPAVETAPVAVAAVAMESPPADVTPDAAPDVPAPTAPAEPVETAPVSLQTIANAYSDFARKSIEQTSSYFEQLARVRSLNKALELQTEFAKQTYETFVAESRKIHELHSELTMQRLRNLEGFVTRLKPTRSA
jgi:hypothetical protein